MRVGFGMDAHRFGGEGPIRLAGVVVAEDRGLVGTSDADVVAHAVADALLGAAGLGDLGSFFPSDDLRWQGADSMELLADVIGHFHAAELSAEWLDTTVIAESVRIAPHREAIRHALAAALAVPDTAVSIKATSTDGMGFTGRDEGIAAIAVVTTT